MPAYKDSRQGTWYASFYFENWQGVKQKKLKRGFATKKDALAWEREFLLQQAADLTMTFEAFVEIYITDKKKRLRENTWSTKEHIIRTKILPYFKEKRLSEIKPRDVIAWQNEMLNYRDKNGKAYSPTYLKTLHGQLSAILNHAVRFYGLKSNAAATAGCMGSEKHKEMLFWTKDLFLPIIVQMGENNPMNLFHDSANDVKDRIGHPASIVFPVGAKADILLLPLVPFHCTTSFSFFTQVSSSGFLSAVLPYEYTHHSFLPDPLVILLLPRCHQKGQQSYLLRLRYASCGR